MMPPRRSPRSFSVGRAFCSVGTHGANIADRPLSSFLVLQSDATNDGRLTAEELYANEVDTDLVVMMRVLLGALLIAHPCPETICSAYSEPCCIPGHVRLCPVCGTLTTVPHQESVARILPAIDSRPVGPRRTSQLSTGVPEDRTWDGKREVG